MSHSNMRWKNLNKPVAVSIGLLHLACFGLIFPSMWTWSGVGIFALFVFISAPIGVTLCYHRLLTHASFKTPTWFKYFLTLCGTLSLQGGPITWVGNHRLHHKHADKEHDPHSPSHGFNWAHILWTLFYAPEGANPRNYAKDLGRDRGIALIDRYFWLPQIIVALALFFGGWAISDWILGLSWVVWGIAVRTVLVYHGTWFVNSAAHTWGYRNYQTDDTSTNLWWVALFSFGEGWHNNHHHEQRSALHGGRRWYELDFTWWIILLLEKIGLAKDVVRPKD